MNRSITLKGVVTRELRVGNEIIYELFMSSSVVMDRRGCTLWGNVVMFGYEWRGNTDPTSHAHAHTHTHLRVEPEVRHRTCRLLLLSSLPSDLHRAFNLCVILP